MEGDPSAGLWIVESGRLKACKLSPDGKEYVLIFRYLREEQDDAYRPVYGSDTGFTELAANLIKEEFDTIAPDLIRVHDIAETPVERVLDYLYLIIGCPTWNIGELQDDWDDVYLILASKKVAIFGLGDQFPGLHAGL